MSTDLPQGGFRLGIIAVAYTQKARGPRMSAAEPALLGLERDDADRRTPAT